MTARTVRVSRAFVAALVVIAGVCTPAAISRADSISVIEELMVPGGLTAAGDQQRIVDSSRLSPQSFRFAAQSEAVGGAAPIQNVVPLEALGLPEQFGLVLDQQSNVPAYEGVTFRMTDGVRVDAKWDFGSKPRSVEGFVDLHLSF